MKSIMLALGFEAVSTGGGCWTYLRQFGDLEVCVTGDDGVLLPEAPAIASGSR